MSLLVGSVEFLLLQSEVPTDHDGTAARKISEKKNNKSRILRVLLQVIALSIDFIL